MDPQLLVSAVSALVSTIVGVVALKFYGTQREQAGEISVLKTAIATQRSDHENVVRLQVEFEHVTGQLEKLEAGMARIEHKLDQRSS